MAALPAKCRVCFEIKTPPSEERKRRSCSLLLLLASVLLGRGGGDSDGNLGLLVLGDGKSLTLGGQTVDHVAALTAGEAIGMVSHVGGNLALVALVLQLLDLARSLDVVVLKECELSLAVLVLDLLGLGVNLLLSLTLATVKGNEGVNAALGLEASLSEGEGLLEVGSVENKSVDGVVNLFLDFGSKQKKRE